MSSFLYAYNGETNPGYGAETARRACALRTSNLWGRGLSTDLVPGNVWYVHT